MPRTWPTRKLTPRVLARALSQAGTVVCEPMTSLRIEVPDTRMDAVLLVLAGLGAEVRAPALHGDLAVVTAMLPSARVRALQAQLPALTGGEGVLESSFGG
ncbi:MAG TPA: hypothetical protein VFQ44_15120 [Streptosporangiaceae bacterium]|nr:hypothetical protein [Streptosporangiaceae bacterium]